MHIVTQSIKSCDSWVGTKGEWIWKQYSISLGAYLNQLMARNLLIDSLGCMNTCSPME